MTYSDLLKQLSAIEPNDNDELIFSHYNKNGEIEFSFNITGVGYIDTNNKNFLNFNDYKEQ